MKTHQFADITLTLHEHHAHVRFGRVHKKNAFNPANHRAMHQVLDTIEASPGVKVTVLTGTGDVFCGGMDLEEYFLDAFHEPARLRQNFAESHAWMRRLKAHPTVTIASVNGWCVGGGMLIALLCDLGLAAHEAKFSLSEVNFGIFPAGGTTWAVSQNLVRKQALRYALTGEVFDGRRAEELGVVSQAVPRAELEAATDALVATLSQRSAAALTYTKRVYERSRTMTFPEAQEWEVAMLFDLSYTTGNDWIERGLKAFQERRYKPALAPAPEEESE